MKNRIETVTTAHSVKQVMDKLQALLEEKSATIFARINHGAGANSASLDIGESELLIFGNPKLGSLVMMDDPLAGLYLPLKVLGYTDANGAVYLAYEDPAHTFKDLSISSEAEYISTMQGVLNALTTAAAS